MPAPAEVQVNLFGEEEKLPAPAEPKKPSDKLKPGDVVEFD